MAPVTGIFLIFALVLGGISGCWKAAVLTLGGDPEPSRGLLQRSKRGLGERGRQVFEGSLCAECGLLEADTPYNTLILLFWAEINRLKPFFYLGSPPLFTCVDSLLGEPYNRDWSHFFVSE